MGQIYSSASRVNIWLGEWDDALVGAVKSLRRIVPTELQASLTGASGGSRSEESGAILQRKAYDNVLGLVKGKRTSGDCI